MTVPRLLVVIAVLLAVIGILLQVIAYAVCNMGVFVQHMARGKGPAYERTKLFHLYAIFYAAAVACLILAWRQP